MNYRLIKALREKTSHADVDFIKDTLKGKQPYLTMNIGTTKDDMPLRLDIHKYEYNSDSEMYLETKVFSECIVLNENDLKAAIYAVKNGDFDCFKYNGIDISDYLNADDRILTQAVFAERLKGFMIDVPANTPVLANRDTKGLQSLLEKIGCRDCLDKIKYSVLPESVVFAKIFGNKGTFIEAAEAITGKDISEIAKWGLWRDFIIDDGSSINISPAGRCFVGNLFMQTVGKSEGYLTKNQYDVTLYEKDKARKSEKTEEARKEYEGKSISEKLEVLKTVGAISKNALDRRSDTAINHFLDTLEGKGCKGFSIIQTATLGLGENNIPIQIAYCLVKAGEDGLSIDKMYNFAIDSRSAMKEAFEDSYNKVCTAKFNPFAYADMNESDYRSGEAEIRTLNGMIDPMELIGVNELEGRLKDFFEKYPTDEYPVFTNGMDKENDDYSFSYGSLRRILPDLPEWNFVDFTQVLKEYALVKEENKEKIPFVDESKPLKRFNLASVAENMGVDSNVGGALGKIFAVYAITEGIYNTDNLIKRPAPEKGTETERIPDAEAEMPTETDLSDFDGLEIRKSAEPDYDNDAFMQYVLENEAEELEEQKASPFAKFRQDDRPLRARPNAYYRRDNEMTTKLEEMLGEILSEIKNMNRRQDNIEANLKHIQKETGIPPIS